MPEAEQPFFGGVATIVFLIALVIVGMGSLRPPAVVSEDAAADEFSGARALESLRVIAAAPHPIGSPEHARVREYIVGEIEDLGLEAEVQIETLTGFFHGLNQVARVRNILTRIEGAQRDSGPLLMAHYDTVAHSPGASDNGAGVAVLLETLRALRAGPPPESDVIFLFSDAEETGLLGAQAFWHHHPWAADVALVVNFEARGSRGPSIMFETGPGTAPLMKRFASLAPRPVAASYGYDIYQRLPNVTDFSVSRQVGKPGFNFAFIADASAYHTALDTIDRIDLRSLQHHGTYALSLARGFADRDLTTATTATTKVVPQVYFNVPFLGLIVYSASLALPLAAFAVLLAVAVIWSGFRRSRLRTGAMLLGALATAGIVAAGGITAFLLHRGLLAILLRRGFPESLSLYRSGLVLAGLAVAVALILVIARKLGVADLGAGAALLWLGLALVTALYSPSSSYLAIWPTVSGLVALLVLVRTAREPTMSGKTVVLLLLLAIPAVVLWVPVIELIGEALAEPEMILAGIAALLATSLVAQLTLLWGMRRSSVVPLTILALGLGMSFFQVAVAGFDSRRPLTNSIFYALDSGRGTAVWASRDRRVDSWTSQFFPSKPRREPLVGFFPSDPDVLVAAAPVFPLLTPLVTDLELSATDADVGTVGGSGVTSQTPAMPSTATPGRRLRLRVESPRQASSLWLKLRSPAPITVLAIDGREIDLTSASNAGAAGGRWQGMLHGGSPQGFEVTAVLAVDEPLSVTVVDRVYGLPGASYTPRPETIQPSSSKTTDLSLVRSEFTF